MKNIDKNSLENAYRLFESNDIEKIKSAPQKASERYTAIYFMVYMILLEK